MRDSGKLVCVVMLWDLITSRCDRETDIGRQWGGPLLKVGLPPLSTWPMSSELGSATWTRAIAILIACVGECKLVHVMVNVTKTSHPVRLRRDRKLVWSFSWWSSWKEGVCWKQEAISHLCSKQCVWFSFWTRLLLL